MFLKVDLPHATSRALQLLIFSKRQYIGLPTVGYGSMNLGLPLRTLGEQPIFLRTGGAFVSCVFVDGAWDLC